MSYTALYRKYRPRTFSDVKGQDHIVITLQNQIKSGKKSHAYLMCGTRGTGKTSIAKIFAKAVNCQAPIEGNPCEECSTCIAIHEGSSLNVIEIDAASNNGVDNIREIREEVAYRPTEGQYKVYIIDEVHMLSTAAENALLKTLEEPPPYVIFILATTDKHKIAATILSRCQQYDFRRMKIETIASRIQELLNNEGVVAEEKAILYIAKKADGSMRDALSLLDQCIGFNIGKELTFNNVLKVLGSAKIEVFSRLLKGILSRDVGSVMELIEEIIMEGSELASFVSDFTWHLRNLLLLKTSDNMEGAQFSHRIEDTLDVTSENIEILKKEAKEVELESLLRFIRITGELSEQLRFTTGKRVAVEVAFIKLCIPAMEVDVDSLLERIRVLEEKIEEGGIVREKRVEAGDGRSFGEVNLVGNRIGESASDGEMLEDRASRDRDFEGRTNAKRPSEERAYEERVSEDRAHEERVSEDRAHEDKVLENPLAGGKSEADRGLEGLISEDGTSRNLAENSKEGKGLDKIVKGFPQLIQSLSPLLGMYFSDKNNYRVRQEGDKSLRVIHNNETACNLLNSPEKKEQLKALILDQTGEEIEIIIEYYGKIEEVHKPQGISELIQEKIKFPITKI